jgi:hypothetical protein
LANDQLTTPMLALTPNDPWTLADACEGTIIFGGNGSGKTSGSGKELAMRFLARGYGGLILTAKVDEADRWVSYAYRAGRSTDLRVVDPKDDYCLNFLDYEATRAGRGTGLTYELVRLLQTAMEGGRERGKSQDPYWDEAVAELLTNAIDLAVLGTDHLSLADVVKIIRSAPLSLADAETMNCTAARLAELRAQTGRDWAGTSLCAKLLTHAEKTVQDPERRADLQETFSYFLHEYASLDPRPRSTILSCLMSRLTGLLRSPFRRLFGGKTTIRPEDTFDGKLIVLNLPIKEYGEVGRFAQILFKTIWQRAVERRGTNGPPVFLWADEAQFFVTRYDMMFQQTARSSRAATVYLTQSVANFRAALDGATPDATSISDSLLGNLQTKIFHANACPLTNEYAERLFGQELKWLQGAAGGAGGTQLNATQAYLPVLPAINFTGLKKGGAVNGRVVEGYVFQAGRRWLGDTGKHNKNWLLAKFMQEQLSVT